MIRYLKFMLKRRTASAGFFSQSGTIKQQSVQLKKPMSLPSKLLLSQLQIKLYNKILIFSHFNY
ncbi:hypothetical protein [Candidatus Tisiphia endosymbiont of Parasteatoda lunata]|uniref:hypothetical protein n=1 Tax=Candidatus Tisiphia endosymbiont of Parasteatoda lunata TaxID=3066275 RepID=UPI00313CF468